MRHARVSVPHCHETARTARDADTLRRCAPWPPGFPRSSSRRSSSPCPRSRTCASRRAPSTSCCASCAHMTVFGLLAAACVRGLTYHGVTQPRAALARRGAGARLRDQRRVPPDLRDRPLRLAHRRRDRPGRDRRRAAAAGRQPAPARAHRGARVTRCSCRTPPSATPTRCSRRRHAPGREVRRDPAARRRRRAGRPRRRRCRRSTPGPATPAGAPRWCASTRPARRCCCAPTPS